MEADKDVHLEITCGGPGDEYWKRSVVNSLELN